MFVPTIASGADPGRGPRGQDNPLPSPLPASLTHMHTHCFVLVVGPNLLFLKEGGGGGSQCVCMVRPQEVHADHGLKVGLHTPTILSATANDVRNGLVHGLTLTPRITWVGSGNGRVRGFEQVTLYRSKGTARQNPAASPGPNPIWVHVGRLGVAVSRTPT